MKKYYVDDKEVFEHQFTILLALSLSQTLQANDESIVIVTETIKRFLEDGRSQNYGMGGRVFSVKEEVKDPTIAVTTTNYDPCKGCPRKDQPYWSITHPCTGCPHFHGGNWQFCSTTASDVSFEVTGISNPANYSGTYVIHDNFLGLKVDAALNRKK